MVRVGRVKRSILAFAIGLVLLLLLMAAVAETHSAFDEAKRFAHDNPRVNALVGGVDRVDLHLLDGWELNGSTAECLLDVSGRVHQATLEVHLVSSAGLWRVSSADLHVQGERSVHAIQKRVVEN